MLTQLDSNVLRSLVARDTARDFRGISARLSGAITRRERPSDSIACLFRSKAAVAKVCFRLRIQSVDATPRL